MASIGKGDVEDTGIILVTTFATANRFDITLLGANVPSPLFAERARELKLDLILLLTYLEQQCQTRRNLSTV